MAEVRARLEKRGFWRSPEARNRLDQVPIGARIGRGTRLSAGDVVELTQTIEAEIIPHLVIAPYFPASFRKLVRSRIRTSAVANDRRLAGIVGGL